MGPVHADATLPAKGSDLTVRMLDGDRPELTSDSAEGVRHDQWRGHGVVAEAIRVAVTAAPVLAVFGVVAGIDSLFPTPHSWSGRVVWSVLILLASAIAAIVVERIARRFLPIAMLLRLTLVFPDRAPSRYLVLRAAASPSRLREIASGADTQVASAASQVLIQLAALTRHDRHTRGHSERVRIFADLIGEQLNIQGLDREKLRWAALLHDVGKISVPAEILNKPGRPTPKEWATLQGHPAAGEKFAGPLFDWLGSWAGGITQHHERFDGKGYPYGIGHYDITLAGRIVAVADCYETMTAARSYKKPMATRDARREIANCAGKHFDPDVARAFLEVSLPKLFWRIGPASFLLHLPFLGHLQHASGRIAAGTSGLAAPSAMAGLGVVTALGAGVGTLTPTVAAAAATPAFTVAPADVLAGGAAGTVAWTTPVAQASGPATSPAAVPTPAAGQLVMPSLANPTRVTSASLGSATTTTDSKAPAVPAAGTAASVSAVPVVGATPSAVPAVATPTAASLGTVVGSTVGGLGATVGSVGAATGDTTDAVGALVGSLGTGVGTTVGDLTDGLLGASGDALGTGVGTTVAGVGGVVAAVGSAAATTVQAAGAGVSALGAVLGNVLSRRAQ